MAVPNSVIQALQVQFHGILKKNAVAACRELARAQQVLEEAETAFLVAEKALEECGAFLDEATGSEVAEYSARATRYFDDAKLEAGLHKDILVLPRQQVL